MMVISGRVSAKTLMIQFYITNEILINHDAIKLHMYTIPNAMFRMIIQRWRIRPILETSIRWPILEYASKRYQCTEVSLPGILCPNWVLLHLSRRSSSNDYLQLLSKYTIVLCNCIEPGGRRKRRVCSVQEHSVLLLLRVLLVLLTIIVSCVHFELRPWAKIPLTRRRNVNLTWRYYFYKIR